MSLTVDTRGVANHEKICYVGTKGIDLNYSKATLHLAWCSMAIGIGEITQKNYLQVYFRHLFLCRISAITKCPVTLEDVKNNIGLKTNVAYETKGKWKNRIVKGVMDSLWYSVIKSEKL